MSTRTTGDGLRAGAGKADITPALGIQLAGDIGRYRPAEEIRERLYARALVLEAAGARCCLLSLDLLAATTAWADEIRQRVARRLGLAPEAVVFHVTQNHAAPSLGHNFVSDTCQLMPPEVPWLRGGDERYNEPCARAVMAAAEQAAAGLRPVRVEAGRGMDGRVAFNRRFILRDGTARCHPPACDPSILHVEGPTDPEVGLLLLRDDQGAVVSGLLHHTCHPCFGYPHRYVIADWPGAWAELMEARLGPGSTPLVINGCCGNVHHANHLDPAQSRDHRRCAALLAETCEAILARLAPLAGVPLAWKRTVLRLPLRLLTTGETSAARALLERWPQPKYLDAERTRVDWDWVYAAATLDLEATQARDPRCDYEIQAFRIGGFGLVTLMGEPFVEAQLRIKQHSPAPYTFVAHFCNGYAGYVPTAGALRRGGYETRTANWSKFQPEALDQIGEAALELLRALF